jgi:hypothetical protein
MNGPEITRVLMPPRYGTMQEEKCKRVRGSGANMIGWRKRVGQGQGSPDIGEMFAWTQGQIRG